LKNKYVRIGTTVLSLVLCFWLVKKAYAGQDFPSIWQHIQEVDLFWVSIIILCSLLCHAVRTLRWQMLLKACGNQVSFWKLFASLMSGYLVNQVVPRFAELFVRCYLLNRSDKVRYGTSMGSILAERIIDTLCLFALLFACFILMSHISFQFFELHIHTPLTDYFGALPFWKIGAFGVGLVALLYFILERLQKKVSTASTETKKTNVVDEFTDESIQGMAAVLKVENKALFGTYTAVIWMLYFFMTYLWFFSLKETSHLGMKEAFFIWMIGSIGRMVPTQGGGAGAYHYLVIQAFLLFGVTASVAGAMALLIHGLQTILYVLLGSISLVAYMALTGKEEESVVS
jgi:uncharacterized protein (TIRG00374 family)